MKRLEVQYRVLPHGEGLLPPVYATDLSAGLDIRAAIEENITILPQSRTLVPTGMQIAVPKGYEAQIRPRSGLALEHGVMVANTPGTIDPDYRGEVKVILMNLGSDPFTVVRGMRIAQMILAPVSRVDLLKVDELPDTGRGSGGFGHTGL
ncbi:dUTP diphosphatase [bacterium]|nr:MAG: dUTP diphosphatase [bacterium]